MLQGIQVRAVLKYVQAAAIDDECSSGDATNTRLFRQIVEVAKVAAFHVTINAHVKIIRIVCAATRVVPLSHVPVRAATFAPHTSGAGELKTGTRSVVHASYACVSFNSADATSHVKSPLACSFVFVSSSIS